MYTYEGERYFTFQEVCKAMNLIADDREWFQTMDEANSYASPSELRQLFVYILFHNDPENGFDLYDQFKNSLSEDFKFNRLQQLNLNMNEDFIPEDYARALWNIQDQIVRLSGDETKSLKLPQFYFVNNSNFQMPPRPQQMQQQQQLDDEDSNFLSELERATSYNADHERDFATENFNQFNKEQKEIFENICNEESNDKLFFVDAPGGSGKTFLFNTILAHFRSQNKIAIPCASSAIAAILLKDGQTMHRRFKLPVPINDDSSCHIPKDSSVEKLLDAADLIIIDEAPQMTRYGFEAIDTALREIMKINLPFGGKKIVLGGDFRQTPPIEPKASQGQIIQLSIKKSYLWESFRIFSLTENLRVGKYILEEENEERIQKFKDHAQFLLDIGNGKLASPDGFTESSTLIPEHYLHPNEELLDFIESIYPDLKNEHPKIQSSADIAILTPLNKDVDKINDIIIDKLAGNVQTFYSADELVNEKQESDELSNLVPVEFINTLEPSGFPKHILRLKIGCCVILLRNLDVEKGLCNGTKMTVLKMSPRVIKCEILTGSRTGQICNIPRINLHHKISKSIGFEFSRRQFPVKIAYCMTISKSQGQTLNKVGIFLPFPCFGHGLFYVGISRCGNPENIKIFIQAYW
jgi:hypothetical protein